MNNRGWGLTEMLVLTAIIIFCLLFASIEANRMKKNINDNIHNNQKYNNDDDDINKNNIETEESLIDDNDIDDFKNIEQFLSNQGEKYIDIYYPNEIEQNNIIVNYKQLLELNSDSNIGNLIKKYSCKGYITIDNNKSINPYIGCTGYATIGYNSSYIE